MVHVGPTDLMTSEDFFPSQENQKDLLVVQQIRQKNIQVQSHKPIFVPMDYNFRVWVNAKEQCCQ